MKSCIVNVLKSRLPVLTTLSRRVPSIVVLACAVAFLSLSGCIKERPKPMLKEYTECFEPIAEVKKALVRFAREDPGNQKLLYSELVGGLRSYRDELIIYALRETESPFLPEMVIEVLRGDYSETARIQVLAIVRLLNGEGIETDELIKLIERDPSSRVRSAGLGVVGRVYGGGQLPFYERMLMDPDMNVRLTAMHSVEKFGNRRSAFALRAMLAKYPSFSDSSTRGQVIAVLQALQRMSGVTPPENLTVTEEVNWWLTCEKLNDPGTNDTKGKSEDRSKRENSAADIEQTQRKP